MAQPAFKVVIVGGSVAGLSLANCLGKLGIDYTLLERRPAVVVQEGASVAVLPNGARILDQLGLYAAVRDCVVPIEVTDAYFPEQNGFRFPSEYPRMLHQKMGYPISFMERRKLLEILYEGLPDKSKVDAGKTVTSVEQDEHGARVHTADGQVYEADVVVGADGVHSRVLREMWRLMGRKVTNNMAECESQNMSVRFSCVFGISYDVPEVEPGEQVLRMANGFTIFLVGSKSETGKPGSNMVFWFLTWELDRDYSYHDAPRYTNADAVALCEARLQTDVKPGMLFSSLWVRRGPINVQPLQESLMETWSHGRVVCVGDSVHKMTINIGQGANSAIEDIAQLSNMLHSLLEGQRDKKPAHAEIEAVLQSFYQQRLPRLRKVDSLARTTCRVHAQISLKDRVLSRYLIPYLGSFIHDKAFTMIAAGPALDFLPPKHTVSPGWAQYGPKKGHHGAFWTAAFLSLAALAVASATQGWGHQGWLDWHRVALQ